MRLGQRGWARGRTGAQDEALAVLGRGHQAGVNGDIWIDLDAADSKTERLQKLLNAPSETSCCSTTPLALATSQELTRPVEDAMIPFPTPIIQKQCTSASAP